ncbi:MAG: CDP-glycerol glycerophosphotransferase family protein [Fidelibacterota bacterium]
MMGYSNTFPPRRYLFFVTQPYSFPILEPLQEFIRKETPGEVRWYTASNARQSSPPGEQLTSWIQVERFSPDAVVVPGNVVPHFWPGLKVQVFHSLGEEKKGYYRITGFFDLYCTGGPVTTRRYVALAQRHGHFMVAQTGWPKLDPLSREVDRQLLRKEMGLSSGKPVLLYAPTFRPKYTSAPDLLSTFQELRRDAWQWVVKFHALMDPAVVEGYRSLERDGFRVVRADSVLPLLQVADLLITDTSSVAYEFLLLDRPIITYRAAARRDKGIDLQTPGELPEAIEHALGNPGEYSNRRKSYLRVLHPYQDGESSRRVVESIENVLQNDLHLKLKPKPHNLVRKWQIRRLVALESS